MVPVEKLQQERSVEALPAHWDEHASRSPRLVAELVMWEHAAPGVVVAVIGWFAPT